MKIQKRDGNLEQLSFDKIIYRLKKLCNDRSLGVLTSIDPDVIAQRVVSSIYDGVTSCELDEEAARIAIGMTENPEYQKLASRIVVSNAHKSTGECFSEVMERLYNNTDSLGNNAPILADDIIEIIRIHKNTINFAIDYNRDYLFDYFGYKTLEKSYLQKIKDKKTGKMQVVERPQHLYMRVAIGIHKENIESAIKTYNLISQHYYTHATPTMFNAGTRLANLASCFHEDTIVATINRGPIKIKDVKIGDLVITHNGNVKPVVQLHKNLLNDRKFYEINISKTVPIKVTDNHKLWAIKKEKKEKEKKSYQKYDLEFVKNYLLQDNCYLLSSKYINIKDKLEYECMCGKIAKTSFENIYYRNIRCNNRDCIFTRNKKLYKNKIIGKPEWISVNDLKKGDYIGIPNKKNETSYISTLDIYSFKNLLENNLDRKLSYTLNATNSIVTLKTHWEYNKGSKEHSSINRYWNIDHDFAKFLGIFYGDGHIITKKDNFGITNCNGIGITIHSINNHLIEYCKIIGEKIFGIKPVIRAMKNQNIVQVLFNSILVGEIFKNLFGIHFNGKKIWIELFKWDKRMILNLLEGLITTDGCITKDQSVSIQMSNTKFMRDLYYLIRNNNIETSYGNERLQKNATQKHVQINIPMHQLNMTNINKTYTDSRLENKIIKKCRNQYSSIEIDSFKFLKFEGKKLISENLPEYVYTLGVEDDHSYNIGGIIAQNCFLIGTHDSIEGIFKTITDCGKISKMAGGIGLHVTNIRAKGSLIRGTNGPSDGLVPMIKVYNEVAKYINQGGKRKGSFAIYLSPWHSDILEFLDLKKNQGHEEIRARDLFYAMWVSDLFMKTVESDGDWYLMCPDECPGLSDVYGDEFEKLYWSYVEQKRYKRVVKAQEVWTRILDSQIETGTPYIGYKDAVNKKCNQKNLGTIRSSNLCLEISLYSDNSEYATCNLASIALPKFVKYDENGKPYFDFEHLKMVAEYIIEPMNKVIDNTHYPVPETKLSNLQHRPLGIGVQGLVDVYVKMRFPFESSEAKKLNKEIFETIYYGTLKGSIELAKIDGHYSSFKGSPFSEGKLQFDLAKEFDGIDLSNYLSGRWDWETLKKELVKYGTRNSMLMALMPTASTAQIMGNSEAFEPVDSCIFKRRVLSGEYIVVNKYLVEDLQKLSLWNKELKDTIIANNGSIQNIDEIPDDLKALYKTVWEISMKSVIEQCSDRQVFVDQMQSMNLFMANPNYKRLTSMHFYAWKNHLKSGMYYLRSKSSVSAGKFSIDPELEKRIKEKQKKGEQLQKEEEEIVLACSRENPEACMMCSS
jgi:ribonucleoside-diphosphate reductase alpha chain